MKHIFVIPNKVTHVPTNKITNSQVSTPAALTINYRNERKYFPLYIIVQWQSTCGNLYSAEVPLK